MLHCNIQKSKLSDNLLEKIESNTLNDRQLVERILSGDTQVFGIIVKNTERLVSQIIFKLVKNEEDRKDLVQEIYLKAFKNLGKFKFQSKLSTWIGQITYNSCINHLEKKKLVLIENRIEEGDLGETKLEFISNKLINKFTNEIELLINGNELSDTLAFEIDRLSPLYRTLITLYHQEEMSYSQICEITNLPEGTVKNYLFRARKKLKESLLSKFKRDEL